jgi:SAM-dependent methyltransferase
MNANSAADLGMGLAPGAAHYRAWVGPPEKYDLVAAMQFNLLTALGLREHHYLLDIGCGSLRAGRLFIPYLLPGHYHGIEPEAWLIEEAIQKEIGRDLVHLKRPVFRHVADFSLTGFGRRFDYIVAQSIFSHTSQSQIRRCLKEARQVMGPESVFAATFITGKEDYDGEAWVYPGCVTYTVDHFRALVTEAGLACRLLHCPHATGQTWLAIVDPQHELLQRDPTEPARLSSIEVELDICKRQLDRVQKHRGVRLALGFHDWLRRVKRRRKSA